MGRRIISEDRKNIKKQIKSKIVIAVEGKNKTENLYFSHFDNGKKSYSISIASGNDTDPLKLVKSLDREIKRRGLNLSEGDKAFCVFDTDIDYNKNKIIKDAKNFANDIGIQIITSNPSIELWFLLHFCYTTGRLSNPQVIKKLRKYFNKYEKNVDIFPHINELVGKAIENAKKLEQFQLSNSNIIGTVEANPSTEVYKLVEYLQNK